MRKSRVFSFNGKVGLTLDIPREESNCVDFCDVAAICYNKTGQAKMNKKYKKKMKRNFKLILSDKFKKTVRKEMLRHNAHQLRIFSNGDIIFNDFKKSDIMFNNIFGLCKSIDRSFWITTRNQNALFRYLTEHKKPDNLNIMLSVNQKDINQGFLSYCESLQIQLSYITDKKKESNCPASKSKKKNNSCVDNDCNKCQTYSKNPRVWLIHGKGNLKKFRELIKIESRR